ncbi:hypothetical protein [Roseibium alexandrii]|uniref:hypothetical protein n=1 Tax=Roseibium alexandrii TaxID=388408 RepID=UPI0037522D83
MGEFTVTKWKCDRCGAVEDKRPWLPVKRSMTANAEYDVAGGSVSWKELCKDCNEWLGDQFKAMNLKL